MAATQNMDFLKKIIKLNPQAQNSSVNHLHICFLGQGIHFLGYFCDLTYKPRNRGQNDSFWGQNWTKIYFFGYHSGYHTNVAQ